MGEQAVDEQLQHPGGLLGVDGGQHDAGYAGGDVGRLDVGAQASVGATGVEDGGDGGVEVFSGLAGADRTARDHRA